MSISFSASVNRNCPGCGHYATHGFFLSTRDEEGPEEEGFLCTACAQRDVPLHTLEDAIEDHRQVCFDQVDTAQAGVERCDEAINEWIRWVDEEAPSAPDRQRHLPDSQAAMQTRLG
jgi:hypothetical protein